jgi:tetratricopeptide (TPR) repeat protein
VDLAETYAAKAVGDSRLAQAAASRAAQHASIQGARLLFAHGRLEEGAALKDLGRGKEAIVAANEARNTFVAVGDRKDAARALVDIGNAIRLSGGSSAERERLYKEALYVFREIGYKKGEAAAVNNIAGVHEDDGDLDGARKWYEESLAIGRLIDDKDYAATALNNIGTVLELGDNLDAAKNKFEQSLAIYREIGAKDDEAMALSNVGAILKLQGDLSGAQRNFEACARLARDIAAKSLVAGALSDSADVLLAQGDISGAKKSYADALAISTEIKNTEAIAGTQLSLARLLIEDHRPGPAEALATQGLTYYTSAGLAYGQVHARAVLARAFFEEDRLKDAEVELQKGLNLLASSHSPNLGHSLDIGMIAARVRAAAGKSSEAISQLEGIVEKAKSDGNREVEFEARLALGEIEMSVNRSAGQAQLESLSKDASVFGLIARKAAQARDAAATVTVDRQ